MLSVNCAAGPKPTLVPASTYNNIASCNKFNKYKVDNLPSQQVILMSMSQIQFL